MSGPVTGGRASSPGEKVKVSMNLTPDDIEILRSLSERRGISMTEVVRLALALEKFIQERTAQGDKVLIEAADKTLRQLHAGLPVKEIGER